jgi:effector-binding domain-containing protein
MIKKVLLFVLLAAIIAACFIPVTQQKTTIIKSSFINAYGLLANPLKWERWRPDLRKAMTTDSSKIIIQKDSSEFSIKYDRLALRVNPKGNSFDVSENQNGRITNYSLMMVPVADKFLNKTIVSIGEKTTAISYLIQKLAPSPFLNEQLKDLKSYLETDSLFYGFNIFKTGVPEGILIVKQKEVLEKDKFTAAAKILAALERYMKVNNIKTMQPLIAQFNQNIKDSVQVKVGFFINKEVKPGDGIELNRMPKGGPLYAARYNGEFSKKGEAYKALNRYFFDHSYRLVILPFETYFDNKLPVSDKDTVNIQVNFGTFPSGGAAK